MEQNEASEVVSLWERLRMGLRLILSGEFARQVVGALRLESKKTAEPAPERVHASGLLLLSALQREGRLVDFLQQDVAAFSDEQVGAAARVVHSGCRKVLNQYFDFAPVSKETEGSKITLPQGFDAERWCLTGNVSGQPPFHGEVRHHGWETRAIRMPSPSPALDPRIVAPAEVELS
jgi:hypothetical protein